MAYAWNILQNGAYRLSNCVIWGLRGSIWMVAGQITPKSTKPAVRETAKRWAVAANHITITMRLIGDAPNPCQNETALTEYLHQTARFETEGP
jgi:hypothetical protein